MQALKQITKLISKIMPTLFVLAMLSSGWYFVHQLQATSSQPEEEQLEEHSSQSVIESVTLSEGKAKSAQIQTEIVQLQMVQHQHTVPGRIQYDAAKHIAVRAPTDGTIQKLFAKPGDTVKKGELLAIMISPEAGRARAEVLKAQSELDLEIKMYQREKAIAENLQHLFELISQGTAIKEIQQELLRVSLGMYREKILSAYSTFLLKQKLRDSVVSVSESGAIAGRVLKQRESELEIAKSLYRSVMDEAAFTTEQSQQKALNRVENAKRQFKIATQQLETLLGYSEKTKTNASAQELSQLELKAPFTGTIEERSYAANERMQQADSIFILADTTQLYVAADIRENDWAAVELETGQLISVLIPAVSSIPLSANIYYIGREVNQKTNAVPLVAIINNEKKQLRPGMFVRVSIPLGKAKKTLAVRSESILHDKSDKFVFVEVGDKSYQKIDVETGLTSEKWVEITKGLSPGQKVVSDGMFILKSELLLEGEE